MTTNHGTCNCVTELTLTAAGTHSDPFSQLEVDLVVTGPAGVMKLPAFWAGGATWRARFAPPLPGRYELRSECTDPSDTGLHGRQFTIDAAPYTGLNEFMRHGRLRISDNRRYLQHEDGTPFLWLAEDWWMGLVGRLKFPHDVQSLAVNRKAKGFSVITLAAGLYPDMAPLDPRGATDGLLPWEPNFARVSPAYYDLADQRIQLLAQLGLVTCITGAWGYYLPAMGMEKMKKHWRYLIARYAALPVVWCVAGEGTMPFYLSTTPLEDAVMQKNGWTDLSRFIGSTDPYRNLRTMHSSNYLGSRDMLADPSVVDFDMMQTGHDGLEAVMPTTRMMREGLVRRPTMPILVGETCFEGCQGINHADVQRVQFWNCMLNGACGHSYGAIGTWNMNTRDEPYGKSPHGSGWGETPWDEAMHWPGSAQVGRGKELLKKLEWWRMEPRPEWVGNYDPKAAITPWCAGVPGEFRVYYCYRPLNSGYRFTCRGLEPGATYQATYFDPTTGKEYDAGIASGDDWMPPTPPIIQDWVVVLRRR